MELLKELKLYIKALDQIKDVCHTEALTNEGSAADVATGQYAAYATCQNMLKEILNNYEKGVLLYENKTA